MPLWGAMVVALDSTTTTTTVAPAAGRQAEAEAVTHEHTRKLKCVVRHDEDESRAKLYTCSYNDPQYPFAIHQNQFSILYNDDVAEPSECVFDSCMWAVGGEHMLAVGIENAIFCVRLGFCRSNRLRTCAKFNEFHPNP